MDLSERRRKNTNLWGRQGAYALREFIHNPALGITPIGFIDDNPRKNSRSVNGYPILADLNHLEQLLDGNSISEIVIPTANISKKKLDFLSQICNSRKISLHRFEVTLEKISPTPSSPVG